MHVSTRVIRTTTKQQKITTTKQQNAKKLNTEIIRCTGLIILEQIKRHTNKSIPQNTPKN